MPLRAATMRQDRAKGVAHSVTDEACCKAVEEVETERKSKKALFDLFVFSCGTPHPPQAVPLPPPGKASVIPTLDTHDNKEQVAKATDT